MNYWERHIGDYARDTGHLSIMEHGVYTILLDRYYATERPIPADQVHRLARARTDDERSAVDAVLGEFFFLDGNEWRHNRADEEIEKASARINAAKANGTKGGRPRKPTETQQKPTGLLPGYENETQQKALQTPDSIKNPTLTGADESQFSDEPDPQGPTRDTAGDVAYWKPAPGQLNPRLVMAGVPIPEPPDLARMLQAFRDYYTGKHHTDGQCYQKFVNWIQRDRSHEKPSTSARPDKPRGFEHGDAIGDEWLRQERQRETHGAVGGFD